ncbi:MAG TPA: DUF309 domain-containing protein [Candidatus Dormibacteraeota bacterium]|nr:DUF309 domain-containing protein [Candidatus Dormibacteraeota bacterium]
MDDAARAEMLDAVDRYNRGDYLAAQEALEALFNRLPGDDQPLVRSLMILATAMHLHFRRGGGRGVLNLLRQAMVILDELSPEREGVATGELFEAAQAYLQELESRQKAGAGFFDRWLAPKIRYR